MTNHDTSDDGLASGQRDDTTLNLFGDTPRAVDLAVWESDLQQLGDARFALEAFIHECVAGYGVPRSPVIDQLISLMPVRDRIALLNHNLGFCNENDEVIQESVEALDYCMDVLASADKLVARFFRQPSAINPDDIAAGADALDLALSRLEASYES